MAPIANLFDDFNDSSINTSKWPTTFGTVVESAGQVCVTADPSFSGIASAFNYSLHQSSAFVEITPASGAGAGSAQTDFAIETTTSGTRALARINTVSGLITFSNEVGFVDGGSVSIPYDPVTMRWVRIRESGGTLYWETSPDGVTWTVRRSTASPAWATSAINLRAALVGFRDVGSAPACFDNFNIASASARPVAVGSEFTVSADGELGLNRCDQVDQAWGYSCTQSAYNGLRKSNDPCGLWVQAPSKQYVTAEVVLKSTSEQNDQTLITLELTNPDTCRPMLFYLPLTAGMRMNVPDSDDTGIFAWTLGVMVTGVDNSDSGFEPVTANDFGTIAGKSPSHFWRGEADYFWTADPGATTTIIVKFKVFSGGGTGKLTQLSARLGIIGMSVMSL